VLVNCVTVYPASQNSHNIKYDVEYVPISDFDIAGTRATTTRDGGGAVA
jgi:hypothetical protein